MSERRVKSAVMGGEGGSFLEGLLGKEKPAEDDEKEPPQSCNTPAIPATCNRSGLQSCASYVTGRP